MYKKGFLRADKFCSEARETLIFAYYLLRLCNAGSHHEKLRFKDIATLHVSINEQRWMEPRDSSLELAIVHSNQLVLGKKMKAYYTKVCPIVKLTDFFRDLYSHTSPQLLSIFW